MDNCRQRVRLEGQLGVTAGRRVQLGGCRSKPMEIRKEGTDTRVIFFPL